MLSNSGSLDSHAAEPSSRAIQDPMEETKTDLERRLDMLDRLEQLENEREKDDDDDVGSGEIHVTTQVASLGLVKGVRLPDAIMLPSNSAIGPDDECDD